MAIFYRTTITAVGPEVAELLDGGILILFAEGAPPELAELSALHRVLEGPAAEAPPVGAAITIGSVTATLTAVGEHAWTKVADIGHVVINFDGATLSGRSGELSASAVPTAELIEAVQPGASITISG
ncbi:MAG TPA: PTS glucitol/sorbitol transporter subunit IIA [Lichenihabitans sp.]|jgi:PTS system glucitol/sorbitol-specific IIA component|nr:PTS glucitol/sorbitol transporter subunit IIA [Lichenihabitans sp.]